jgi:hypothetical protein
MILETALAQQLAGLLAPALPFLAGPTATALKDAAGKAAGGKLGEAAWDKAVKVWEKLLPQVEREPEVSKAIKEVAEKGDDPRAEAILSWELEKLLKALPDETLKEIKGILEAKTEGGAAIAIDRGVAIGGNASDNVIITGDRSFVKK